MSNCKTTLLEVVQRWFSNIKKGLLGLYTNKYYYYYYYDDDDDDDDDDNLHLHCEMMKGNAIAE